MSLQEEACCGGNGCAHILQTGKLDEKCDLAFAPIRQAAYAEPWTDNTNLSCPMIDRNPISLYQDDRDNQVDSKQMKEKLDQGGGRYITPLFSPSGFKSGSRPNTNKLTLTRPKANTHYYSEWYWPRTTAAHRLDECQVRMRFIIASCIGLQATDILLSVIFFSII